LKGEINGTILAVNQQNLTLNCAVTGSVIAGSVTIEKPVDLIIDSTVTAVSFIPEPATLILLAMGGLLLTRRRA